MAAVKRLAFLCLAALVLAGPAGAAQKPTTTTASSSAGGKATVACRNKIINQWEGTGKISTSYPVACYKAALAFVNKQQDLSTYSSLGDDIRLALQARLRAATGVKVPSLVIDQKYVRSIKKHHHGTGTSTGPAQTDGTGGYVTGTTTTALASGSGDSSSGTPLPILILGGLAIVLVAAGAIGTAVRYQRRRGSGPPPAV